MNVTRPNLSLVVGLSQAEEKVPASLGTLLCPLRFFSQIVFFCFSTAFGPWRGVNHCTPCFLFCSGTMGDLSGDVTPASSGVPPPEKARPSAPRSSPLTQHGSHTFTSHSPTPPVEV